MLFTRPSLIRSHFTYLCALVFVIFIFHFIFPDSGWHCGPIIVVIFVAVDVAIVIRFALSFFGFLLFSGAAKISLFFVFVHFISFRSFFSLLVCYFIP